MTSKDKKARDSDQRAANAAEAARIRVISSANLRLATSTVTIARS